MQYQKLAARTISDVDPTQWSKQQADLAIAALGITGEGGEFSDHVKKHLAQGHPLDLDKLRKELGDLMWYVAYACTALDVNMEQVQAENIMKLMRRYPEGFTTEASIARVDVE